MKETKENEPQIREWTLDEALTSIGIGKVHYFIMLISGLIIGSLATETSSMNFIMKSAECDLDLTSAQKGLLSTAAYAGDMVTSLIWGYMSDTLGRRKVMKWSSLCMSVFSIVSSFSPNFIMFLIMRFFVGVFISSSNASIYPYLGEFMPIKFRQTIMSIASFSIGMALVYVPAIASFVLPLDIEFSVFGLFNYRSWRLLIVFCALPEIIGTIGLFCLPESPKYLIGQGRDSEALKVISWVYAKNSGLALIWITNKILTLTLFILFISLSGVMVAVVQGAAVLLFPTNNRAMAVCIISIMGGLGTILGSNFLGAFLYVNCELSIGAIAVKICVNMTMNLENSSENQTSIREWKFEEALTHIGIGKIHFLIIINSGLLIGASITETMNMTFIMKSAECDLELSSADKGVLSSVAYMGVMLTSVIWGLLSDIRGRRNLMKWTAMLTTIFSILSSFSPNYTVLLVMRFLVGVL
uniref:CSON002523 protein n=1 Tax=Culicoides sonorensis TaxID=179676 RepID=A0A336LS67_CULSO